eukprot:11572288-Ditylum_brightwellii.AAC.1
MYTEQPFKSAKTTPTTLQEGEDIQEEVDIQEKEDIQEGVDIQEEEMFVDVTFKTAKLDQHARVTTPPSSNFGTCDDSKHSFSETIQGKEGDTPPCHKSPTYAVEEGMFTQPNDVISNAIVDAPKEKVTMPWRMNDSNNGECVLNSPKKTVEENECNSKSTEMTNETSTQATDVCTKGSKFHAEAKVEEMAKENESRALSNMTNEAANSSFAQTINSSKPSFCYNAGEGMKNHGVTVSNVQTTVVETRIEHGNVASTQNSNIRAASYTQPIDSSKPSFCYDADEGMKNHGANVSKSPHARIKPVETRIEHENVDKTQNSNIKAANPSFTQPIDSSKPSFCYDADEDVKNHCAIVSKSPHVQTTVVKKMERNSILTASIESAHDKTPATNENPNHMDAT